MNHDRRAESSRSGQGTSTSSFDYSLLNPHLRNLPPRSKTGCWTCRRRKVKCGEERPICAQCVRLGQQCDYSVRYNFKDVNKNCVIEKVDLEGNPAWDPQTRKPRRLPSSDLDDTPDFTTLSTEEDRERKATFHEPGKFYVVANQDSFSSLPEYSQSSTRRSSSTLGAGGGISGRTSRSKRHSHGESDVSPAGEDTVILNRFEMPTDRPVEKRTTASPSTASRTRTSPSEHRYQSSQLPLPSLTPHYTQPSSSASTSYSGQPLRSSYQPTPLNTSSLDYYNNPLSSSSSTYTSHSQHSQQSQQSSPHHPQDPQFSSQAGAPYPNPYQHAQTMPGDSPQYGPFSRLLPQPTLSTSQRHHQSQYLLQPPHPSTMQPPPLTHHSPYINSTSYTHTTNPSMYHYATPTAITSPTTYAQNPNTYTSPSALAPSYIQTLPEPTPYTQIPPGPVYTHPQPQSQPSAMYAQPYTDSHTVVEATRYGNLSSQEVLPPTTYGYGFAQAQGQGQQTGQQQQVGQNMQEQGYARYGEYQSR